MRRVCTGCTNVYTVYGPFQTKEVYRCWRCESQPKRTVGTQASHRNLRLDELERGSLWYKDSKGD